MQNFTPAQISRLQALFSTDSALQPGDNVSELVNDANYVSTDDTTYRILVAAEWEELTVNLDIDGVVTPRTILVKVVP